MCSSFRYCSFSQHSSLLFCVHLIHKVSPHTSDSSNGRAPLSRKKWHSSGKCDCLSVDLWSIVSRNNEELVANLYPGGFRCSCTLPCTSGAEGVGGRVLHGNLTRVPGIWPKFQFHNLECARYERYHQFDTVPDRQNQRQLRLLSPRRVV